MSKVSQPSRATVKTLHTRKQEGRRISAITCYDAAFARLLDQTAIDLVLVGDSLGNVVLGFDDTIPVSVEMMVHHTAAVSRALHKPHLCADMPFLSYKVSVEQALANAGRLLQEGGAQSVKVEGGRNIVPQVQALVQAGIPVIGHLGFTPQSLHAIGGYRVSGRDEDEAERMRKDALALQDAGAFALVLEMVPRQLAKELTEMLTIPTIGIGAGPECDGQIIVLHDILGFSPEFEPKFLKRYANLSEQIRTAVTQYDQEVKEGIFPAAEHCYDGQSHR